MERRHFLKMIGRTASGGIIVGLYACGTTKYTAGGVDCVAYPTDPSCTGGGGGGGGGGTGPIFTSDIANTHTHTFTIPNGDLTSPSGDKTYTSSTVGGHTHDVTLTAAERTSIDGNGTVSKTTADASTGASHTHGISFEIPVDMVRDTTTTASHFHTFTIPGTDFVTPTGSKTYTSSAVGHTHKITLSQAQRETIANGGAFNGTVGPLTTTSGGGHTHDVTLLYL